MKELHGFTLIEIALVLVIVSFLGSFLIPLTEYWDQQRIELTQQRLEKIKEALLGFAVIHGYLPCPAIDDKGKETGRNSTGRRCVTHDRSDGYLPWADLGVGRYDAWGNPFRYRVDGWFSNSDGIYTGINALVGKTENPLEVTEKKVIGKPVYQLNISNDSTYRANIVAIIFSCGKNGRPDNKNDADETPNSDASCQNDEAGDKHDYVQDVYVEDQFDDLLTWLPKYILLNRLAAAGRWPP